MKHRYKRTVRLALISALAGILCLLLTGCNKDDKEESATVSVQAATVQKTDISRVVNAEATIFPVAQSAITPKLQALRSA